MLRFAEVIGLISRKRALPLLCAAVAVAVLGIVGCSKEPDTGAVKPTGGPGTGAQDAEFCDLKAGPQDAPVKVLAFYPGRHEDTLAAVRSLLETFKGKVQVEIVDWRHEEGMARRDAAGLVCAGITINAKSAFDLEVAGEKTKVLFQRGIDGEWTKADLEAAVRQELQAAAAD